VAYTNEVARICEQVGADAAEVERGLRSEPRIGQRAYVKAGAPIAGGTLSRDVSFLIELARAHDVQSPILQGIQQSNRAHMGWVHDRLDEMLVGVVAPRVALLGLTYKVGTDTLRRSSAIELARWLLDRAVVVHAYDPAIHELPVDAPALHLASSIDAALAGADVAVLATPWPDFTSIESDRLVRVMRRPQLVDQVGFLPQLAADERVRYVRVGRPLAPRVSR
jgi:UDPglucose 6-dehydrogenase